MAFTIKWRLPRQLELELDSRSMESRVKVDSSSIQGQCKVRSRLEIVHRVQTLTDTDNIPRFAEHVCARFDFQRLEH